MSAPMFQSSKVHEAIGNTRSIQIEELESGKVVVDSPCKVLELTAEGGSERFAFDSTIRYREYLLPLKQGPDKDIQ